MRSAYLETLYDLAEKDERVYAVISDNGAIVYDDFKAAFPDRLLNAGIAEANMVGMSAGLARRGKIPFAYTIGAFLAYRAYEFILNDVCLQNQNVKMVGIGEGVSYSLLGSSHHTLYDMAVLRPIPNLIILSPASPMEVKKAVRAAYEIEGPVYIRLGTNREKEIYKEDYKFEVGKGIELIRGNDLTLISTGSIVPDTLEIADKLINKGLSVRVINLHTIKPVDRDIILKAATETKLICTIEEHSIYGGLGSLVSEVVAEGCRSAVVKRIGFKDEFAIGYGKHNEVKEMNGLGIDKVTNDIEDYYQNIER